MTKIVSWLNNPKIVAVMVALFLLGLFRMFAGKVRG